MSRLIAFGCSYTFGDALPDCTNSYISNPSKYAWPNLLKKRLNADEVVNNGLSGAGNLEILWNILNFNFQPTDICIIMWSHFSRDHIFAETGHVRINHNSSLEKHWGVVHTDYDLGIRNWIMIHHADLYLSNLKIKNHFYLLGGQPEIEKQNMPSFINLKHFIDLNFDNEDFGSDNSHPGVNSHATMAKKIHKIIKGVVHYE